MSVVAPGSHRSPAGTASFGGAHAGTKPFPTWVFALYGYFLIDYFLHVPQRFQAYGALRPTLLLGAFLSVVLAANMDRVRVRMRDPIVRALLALVAYVILSVPLVEWPGSVLRENLAEFVKAVLFFFFTAFFVDTERRLRITLGLWLGLQLVRILEPLWLNLTEGYMGSSTYVGAGEFAGRLSGAPADVINPNGLGFLVVTMLPFLHYLLGASPSRLAKLLYVSIVPALVYVLVETASRGAFLTLFVAALLIFVRSRHKALLLALGLVGALVTWNAMSEFNQERYLSIFTDDTPQSATVDGRLRGMRKEFGLALDNPLFGHGVGTSAEAKHHAGYRAQAAHSLYAEVLVEIGVIGFCIFAAYLVRVRRVVRENARAFADDAETEGSSFHHRLDLALATVFWVYAVYSINYYGLSQDYWYFFGGFCVAFGNAIERRRDEPGPSPRRRPATGYRLAPDRSPLA